MADYEIFREQLAIKYPSYGYALWEPSPRNPNRPVQIGDVGFIREGRFYRLFNALLPADNPSQELGVPEDHKPLVPTLSDHVATVPLGRNNYCSAGVMVEADPGYHSSPDDFPQVLFRNETTRTAAVLSLPVIARRENTLIRNTLGRWMVRHIDTWFAFARNFGLVHQMEEIILVTGCDLTRSWTNIAFLGGCADARVSFGVKVEAPNTSINFQFSPESGRGAVLQHGPEGTNLPENQCVFIRGFRVAPSLWILPKRLKAAAGPSPDPGGYGSDSDMEVISIPAISQFRDPLHLLSDYIAEVGTTCLVSCLCSSYCVWSQRQLCSKHLIAIKYSFMTMTC
ncbi:hypothetical protein F5888DRAFT_1236026 [Russula emetica]|nr:hypothetical protein F5888DRAFT_1236026 [Russula emetica]